MISLNKPGSPLACIAHRCVCVCVCVGQVFALSRSVTRTRPMARTKPSRQSAPSPVQLPKKQGALPCPHRVTYSASSVLRHMTLHMHPQAHRAGTIICTVAPGVEECVPCSTSSAHHFVVSFRSPGRLFPLHPEQEAQCQPSCGWPVSHLDRRVGIFRWS